MTDFKIGDAVIGAVSGSIYVVTNVRDPNVYDCPLRVLREDGAVFHNALLENYTVAVAAAPDWIIKWREGNLPPIAPIDTEESKADVLRRIARENMELREEARNNCDDIDLRNAAITGLKEERDALGKRLGERNEEIFEFQRRACKAERDLKSATLTRNASIQTADDLLEKLDKVRKECADAAFVNTELSEALRLVREELAAENMHNQEHAEYIGKLCEELSELKRVRDCGRWVQLNDVDVPKNIELWKELAAEKMHNENHAEHISKLCEEMSELRRLSDLWIKQNGINVKRYIKLKKELAAEKAFNVSSEPVARTGASEKIEELKKELAIVKEFNTFFGEQTLTHWQDKCAALQLKLDNIRSIICYTETDPC